MKKKTRERNLKKVSIVCIIAIIVVLACQFVTCWEYTGITEDVETGEQRVVDMKMSLASYIWFPSSNEKGLSFTNYVADPSLRFKEKYTAYELYEEDLEILEQTLIDNGLLYEEDLAEKEEEKYEDEYSIYFGSIIEIKEYHVDIFKEKKILLSTFDPEGKVVENYYKFVEGIDNENDPVFYNNYINKVVLFPAILFIGAIAGIIVTLLVTIRKKKLILAPSIFTVALGFLNIVNLFVQPLFLLTTTKTFVILGVIYLLVALVGLVNLIKDAKIIKASKAL